LQRSIEKILTTHVAALPCPAETWSGGPVSDEKLRAAVADVVARQRSVGVDVVNEGELTKGGNWVAFINSRLSGFESMPAEGTLKLLKSSRDWIEFEDFYNKAMAGGTLFEQTASAPAQTTGIVDWRCTAPIGYIGQASLARRSACCATR
jgi:5-methyltetrahydropteroyltriglutamate--homocysteine methyltransferase